MTRISGRRRENGDSGPDSDVHNQNRRSKRLTGRVGTSHSHFTTVKTTLANLQSANSQQIYSTQMSIHLELFVYPFLMRTVAAASLLTALKQPTIKVVAIIAEGVPESDAKQLIAYAWANNKVVIGPATVGGIQAGPFKIGDTAGTRRQFEEKEDKARRNHFVAVMNQCLNRYKTTEINI